MAPTFRGTGGTIGHDYTLVITQACADVVEEIPDSVPGVWAAFPSVQQEIPARETATSTSRLA